MSIYEVTMDEYEGNFHKEMKKIKADNNISIHHILDDRRNIKNLLCFVKCPGK